MNGIEAWLASLGISGSSAFFGFLGALLAALRGSERSPIQRVVSFLTGLAFAMVAPGFIIKYFHLPAEAQYFSGLGFVCGYFGMALMDAATDLVVQLRTLDVQGIVKSWLSRGGKP